MPKIESYAQGTPTGSSSSRRTRRRREVLRRPVRLGISRRTRWRGRALLHDGHLEGDAVAGISCQLAEMSDHPAFWGVYLAVDDVDAVAARVGPAGGKVEAGPFDFMDVRADGGASRTRPVPGSACGRPARPRHGRAPTSPGRRSGTS